MAGTAGYRSPVNLPIGQIPLTTDPEMFEELTDVYNAIHQINQYLDNLRIIAEGGGSGQTPVETLTFNRFYTGTALEDIEKGSPVAPSLRSGENGIIPGMLSYGYASTAPEAWFCGVALNAAAKGSPVQVGVGPGAVGLAGAVAGQYIWAHCSINTNGTHSLQGQFYAANPGAIANANGTAYAGPVGICIADGYALIGIYTPR